MTSAAKSSPLSLRITRREKAELSNIARVSGSSPGTLAASFIREGLRRARFPAIEFRDGRPGRVAYLAGTRWPVWMIVQLVEECAADVGRAATHMRKPPALIEMALGYARAYPDEIEACLALHDHVAGADPQHLVPGVEVL